MTSCQTQPLDEPCIDRVSLLTMVGNDSDLVKELFDMFLADAPGQLQRMYTAIAMNDVAILQAESHTLKGAAGSLRLTSVAQEALGVERAAQDRDLIAASAALHRLELSVAHIPAAFGRLMESIS